VTDAAAPAIPARVTGSLRALVLALDGAIEAIKSRAERTKHGIGLHSFAPYHSYREAIDQYAALDATIRGRFRLVDKDAREALGEVLLHSERRFITTTVKASVDFFFALSAISVLPLGTKELFERELGFLHTAAERLRSPDHAGDFAAELEPDLEMAEQILVEIMEKAPSLTDFSIEVLSLTEPLKALPAQ
jgi:hypothetical protein